MWAMAIPAAMSVAGSLLGGLGGGDDEQNSTSTTTYNYDPTAKAMANKVKKYTNRVLRPEVESYYQKYKSGFTPEAGQWWQRISDLYGKGGPQSLQQAHAATMNQAQALSKDPLYFMNQVGWKDIINSVKKRQAMEPELQARELEGTMGDAIGGMGLGKRQYAEAALQSQVTRENEMSQLLAQRLAAEQEAKKYGFDALPRAWSAAEAFDPEGAARAKEQMMWQQLPLEAQGNILNQFLNQALNSYISPWLNVSQMFFSHPDSVTTEGTTTGGGQSAGNSMLGGLGSMLSQAGQGGFSGIMKYLMPGGGGATPTTA